MIGHANNVSNIQSPADSVEFEVPDNFVNYTLKKSKALPPISWNNWWRELNYLNLAVVGFPHVVMLYGLFTTKLRWQTALLGILYYLFTGLGITAGYHRLWSHRSYNATRPLEYLLALAGSGAAQGSIKWWSRKHRSHHRYTDTDLDPYNVQRGLVWAHIGWVIFKPRIRPGSADISDLNRDDVVRWQHRRYIWLMMIMSFGVPTLIAGLWWGDWRGGYVYASAVRMCFVHHSTFCINSLAHYLGDAPFDDKHSPKDHFITALVTVGEGYHNFHHQFPMDYRNAIKWYQYDPTKWFIWVCSKLGLASHLKTFPDNEVKKGELTMQLKRLRETQDGISWPEQVDHLPIVSWREFQEQSINRPLVLIAGFIHDVNSFIEEHPGGRHMLAKYIGKDATTAFFGGVYDHSNAAHNFLSMMRVGVLAGGQPHALEDKFVPPSQRLRIARISELSSPYTSTDGESIFP
ncbi:hypothetical protein HETIRDRAFT_422558 [Heterobasidion irregulare TC 32-1]|uniref:Acyl-CoA desaturase n=1 Tax=Heterobasidion irregulare (strain TC 32-1) TaxID=747525 RepID=W4JQW4_HETIT|nr:uncharacterized protein HETIRDRAFT_422558 [Heterobasidion irregulare TC 32-1]ETW75928.1 hypothetical protein HETIRDRAFT_422558 [Heterobasidion irregulare TC 32-1]